MTHTGSPGFLAASACLLSWMIDKATASPYRSTSHVLSRIMCFPRRLVWVECVALMYVALCAQLPLQASQSSYSWVMILESQSLEAPGGRIPRTGIFGMCTRNKIISHKLIMIDGCG